MMFATAIGAALATPTAHAQDEVPFITTPDHVTLAMLELAGLKRGEHLLDLGSGDGRIVITAARRFGATGLGVEIVPDLVARSRELAQRAGVAASVEFRQQDLFAPEMVAEMTRAQVITLYLLQAVNLQLRPQLLNLAPGTRIVSHDWDMGDWEPERTVTLDVPDKAVGREKKSRVHLWVVPARVQGLWCAAGTTLDVTQRFQRFSATLTRHRPGVNPAATRLVFDGRLNPRDGRGMSTPDGATAYVQLHAADDALVWVSSSAPVASDLNGSRFRRSVDGRRCD